MNLLQFLYCCYRAYRSNEKLAYFALIDSYGVPRLTVAIGKGREAWRVSQFAVDENQKRHRHEIFVRIGQAQSVLCPEGGK